jgi:hypothetical protein
MYFITRAPQYRDMVYMINDRVIEWYERNAVESPYFDYKGLLAPLPKSYGNVSVTAAALESLVDACQTARLDGDNTRAKRYQKGIISAVAYLLRLQYRVENTYYIKNKQAVTGAFKYDLIKNRVWCDNVWHLTSAFIKIIKYKLLE